MGVNFKHPTNKAFDSLSVDSDSRDSKETPGLLLAIDQDIVRPFIYDDNLSPQDTL